MKKFLKFQTKSFRSRFSAANAIRPDTVFVPMHWADSQNVNDLIAETLDPSCSMPGFKVCSVKIRPSVDNFVNKLS
ncbi:hypothetical protein DT075_34590 [Bacillus licheniformis]|nr:hypothetical protein DT075_34590 [Bacillus licheniformis]